MSTADLACYRTKAAGRKSISRFTRNQKDISVNSATLTLMTSSTPAGSPNSNRIYCGRQSFSKEVKQVKVALLFSPCKKRCVVSTLAQEFGVFNTKNKGISEVAKDVVVGFSYRNYVTYDVWNDRCNDCMEG